MSEHLILKDNLNGTWTLVADLEVWSPSGVLCVPSGFTTDLASVPRPLWSIVPPFGRHGRAAVVHDYLYRVKPKVSYEVGGARCEMPLARGQADKVFRDLMVQDGVPRWRAWAMWAAVRAFGRGAWA